MENILIINESYVEEKGWTQEVVSAILNLDNAGLRRIFGCVPIFEEINDTIRYVEKEEPIEILMIQESEEYFSSDNGYATGTLKGIYSPLEEIPLE